MSSADVASLLAAIDAAGVHFAVTEGRLRLEPAGRATAALVAELRAQWHVTRVLAAPHLATMAHLELAVASFDPEHAEWWRSTVPMLARDLAGDTLAAARRAFVQLAAAVRAPTKPPGPTFEGLAVLSPAEEAAYHHGAGALTAEYWRAAAVRRRWGTGWPGAAERDDAIAGERDALERSLALSGAARAPAEVPATLEEDRRPVRARGTR